MPNWPLAHARIGVQMGTYDCGCTIRTRGTKKNPLWMGTGVVRNRVPRKCSHRRLLCGSTPHVCAHVTKSTPGGFLGVVTPRSPLCARRRHHAATPCASPHWGEVGGRQGGWGTEAIHCPLVCCKQPKPDTLREAPKRKVTF